MNHKNTYLRLLAMAAMMGSFNGDGIPFDSSNAHRERQDTESQLEMYKPTPQRMSKKRKAILKKKNNIK